MPTLIYFRSLLIIILLTSSQITHDITSRLKTRLILFFDLLIQILNLIQFSDSFFKEASIKFIKDPPFYHRLP